MSQQRTTINKIAPSIDVSLNTRFIFPINKAGDGVDFGKYLNTLDAFFAEKEAFTWISLVTAGTDFVDVKLDQITGTTATFTKIFSMRVGQTLPCRAVRIMVDTDISAQFVVGVGA